MRVTPELAEQIRHDRAAGASRPAIARARGVCEHTVMRIDLGEWNPPPAPKPCATRGCRHFVKQSGYCTVCKGRARRILSPGRCIDCSQSAEPRRRRCARHLERARRDSAARRAARGLR